MAVIMPRTEQPMTIGEQNVVAVLDGSKAGLRREEIANLVLSPISSAAKVDAAIASLIDGGAVAGPDEDARYTLTPEGHKAALFGTFGVSEEG